MDSLRIPNGASFKIITPHSAYCLQNLSEKPWNNLEQNRVLVTAHFPGVITL